MLRDRDQRAEELLSQTMNERDRLRIKLEQAHSALDLLEPCPPRIAHTSERGNQVAYTVAGRVDWYREHLHEVWHRVESAGPC